MTYCIVNIYTLVNFWQALLLVDFDFFGFVNFSASFPLACAPCISSPANKNKIRTVSVLGLERVQVIHYEHM